MAVEPVPASAPRPHILLDPDLAHRPPDPPARMPNLPPAQVADAIVAVLLQGTGPILLCVPGTLGSDFETSMLAIARSFVHEAAGPWSAASIPYPNGIFDVVTRFFGIGTDPDQNVLALVLRRLRAAAPHRPILLTGESQGAWLIADTLRQDPSLAAIVTRITLFAKPGFVHLPNAIGSAADGAGLLAPTPAGSNGILEFAHTDDIVPSLFGSFGPHVLAGYVHGLVSKLLGQPFDYRPHHYDADGLAGARWLLLGERPAYAPVHESDTHPEHPPLP